MLSHRCRRRLRDQTKYEVRLDSGTPYPCTRRELESVLHPQGVDLSHHHHGHHNAQYFEPYDEYDEGYVDLPEIFEDDYDLPTIFENGYGTPSYHGNRYELPPIFEDGYGPPLYPDYHYEPHPFFEDGYDPSPVREYDAYHDSHHRGRRRDRPSAMDAARKLSHHLRKPLNEKESRAATRLQAIHNLTTWGPDIVMKAFVDLSTLLFADRLRDRVRLKWRSSQEMAMTGDPGLATAFGYARPWQIGRKTVIEICLNKDTIFMQERFEPWKKMWGTLLHEMCHAYLDIQAPGAPSEEHGAEFQRIFGAVHRRAREVIEIRPGW